MRTPIYVLIAALFIGGCTHHHHAAPSATPSPVHRVEVPEPEPVDPLDLDVGRPSGTQLLIQTNRPAYVAIFEIIPNRGVSLIYPAAVHQQNMMVSGLTWVPLWWSPKRVVFNSNRYIYAVASEEPLSLSAETFERDYLHRVLGARIYGAESPYSTMRAISRQVVPDVADDEWAEDVYVIEPTFATQVHRTARIHCPGSRVFEVPDDMVSRIWCPTRTRVVIVDASRPRTRDYPVGRPVRPDSVFGHGGGRVRFEPRRPRGPIARIVDPTGRDRDDRDRDPRRRGPPEKAEKDEKEKDKQKARKDDDKDTDAEKAKDEKPKKDNNKDSDDKDKPKKNDDEKDSEKDKPNKNDDEKDSDDKRKKAKEKEANDRSRGPSWFKPRRAADEPSRREAEERKDEAKQQGEAREEKRDAKPEEKREEKRETKPSGRLKDLVKQVKDKEKEKEKEEKEKKDKP